ncbi:Protein of unknown function [Cotesia congregata]|uniref:Uncharacterized protein n=1 Tax=Cotesia congregata TaxID=51543 RepID=A0A8J2HFY5_COTCN|nr:Protein of unknown function [Cotesia congregata]
MDVSNMCDVLGICYDVKFVSTLAKKKHDNITKIELNLKAAAISHNCSGFYYNNKCYSFPGGTCRVSEDCLSTSYSCQSGTCKSTVYIKNEESLSSKPGVTAKFIQDRNATKKDQGFLSGNDWGAPLYVCRASLLDYLLIESNLEWTSSVYHPDKAIYGGHQENGLLYLICRANHTSLSIGVG